MPKLQTLSTAALPAGLRVSRWNAFCSDTLADFAVDPVDRATFTAVISRRMIRDVGLAWLSSDPAICYGGVGGVGAWAAPDGDAFLLTAPESGWIWGDHIGRTTQQSAGDMVLLDSARPWRTVARSPTSMTVVKIPATRLIGLVGDPEAVCGMQLGADQPKVALASALIRSVRAAVAADPEGDWGEETERVLLEAAKLALADALAGAAALTAKEPSCGAGSRASSNATSSDPTSAWR